MSIKSRLQWWLLSGLAILGLCYLLADFLNDRALLEDIYDDQMSQIALAMPSHLLNEVQMQDVELPEYESDDSILQIWDHNGKLIYRSNPALVLPQFYTAGFSVADWQGGQWKLYIRHTDQHLVQVAQSLSGRRDIAIEHALRSLVPLLIFLLIMGLLIHRCVDQGLLALTRLSHELATRTPEKLEGLSSADQPSEIKPLTHALDTLLQRLGLALDSQKKFIADASHELRTPLAILQIQTQLVEQSLGSGQEHAALADLKAGVKRASHLAEQLLLVSRLESGAQHEPHQPVQLHDLVRRVTIDFLPYANTRQINLGVEQMDVVVINGSEYHLALLIRNLIDNAVRYTPVGGQVDISLSVSAAAVTLEIEDSGPGIASTERGRVFDRFYRCLVPQASGSGLGLAIVKQVAEQHQAQVSLSRSTRLQGLSVSVCFTLPTWFEQDRAGSTVRLPSPTPAPAAVQGQH